MFELEKKFTFEAGHVLSHHDGKCSRPHGHSYTLVVRVIGEKLIPHGPKTNMIVDFQDISHVVKPMIRDYFDHHWINETLQCDSPTCEFMAKWIYDYLIKYFPELTSITLYETASSIVTYKPLK